jgi:hypothetical protein
MNEIESVENCLKSNIEDSSKEDEYQESDEDLSEECSEDESEIEDNDINVNEPIKKKRGRKSKPKDETESNEKMQKKRGRKPKIKSTEVEDEKIPKKRGRKPKEKVYSVKELPKTFYEENKNDPLVLHIPITSADKNNNPEPNNNELILNYSSYNSINTNNLHTLDKNNIELNNNDLIGMDVNYSSYYPLNESPPSQFNFEMNSTNLFLTKEESFKDSKEKNSVTRDIIIPIEEDNKNNRVIKKNLKNIMYEFINANNDKIWPETTNIYCWWCCHPFTWMPCALPEYYKKDKFYVNGCFCTFNCAASYNFSKCDDDIWERYSLLNLMYKKIYNTKFIKINLAPPREILKIFGGYMSIDEFRENSHKNDKTFTVINPPLISIIPKIEENVSNSYKTGAKGNISLVNENILNKTQNSLKLKRNKPVTNPNNTLQSFMDLKII